MKCTVLTIIGVIYLTSPTADSKKQTNVNCRKPFFQLIFNSRERFRTMEEANMSNSCSWLNGCKRQKRICKRNKALSRVFWNARKLAVNHCELQFKYEQWNCTPSNTRYFKDAYRETGYMQAIAAASLMYSYSIACSEGLILNYKFEKHVKTVQIDELQNGECTVNKAFAKRMAKKFLGIGKKGDAFFMLAKHNSEIGFKVVQSNMEKRCRCHGLSVSGSCSVQTCSRIPKPFEKISESLKNEYHRAMLVNFTNAMQHPLRNTFRRILYTKPTYNLCQTTIGRQCNGADNCATLCCGRGFDVKSVEVLYICNCEWRDHAVFNGNDLVCKQCSKNRNIYTCK